LDASFRKTLGGWHAVCFARMLIGPAVFSSKKGITNFFSFSAVKDQFLFVRFDGNITFAIPTGKSG